MANSKYYDGTKLLSLLDVNGKKPKVYMVTSNRTAGKTTFWHRWLLRRFLNHGEKFCLLYRYKEELHNVDGKFFKDINQLFYKNYTMKEIVQEHGAYVELYICEKGQEENEEAWKLCGYALAINIADKYKKYSHYFSDVSRIYFDEFQAEFGKYCSNEIEKLENIHTSLARGQGEQSRYVPVIMASNTVSLVNPYFTAYNITNRIQKDTKFLRGEGFVLECNFNESASKALEENSLFPSNYTNYQTKGLYCLDNNNFIQKKTGPNKYKFTLYKGSKAYGVRLYSDGILYINKQIDSTCINKISCDIESHNVGLIMDANYFYKKEMLEYFNRGMLRFYDLETKNAVMEFLTSIFH